jgi:hypothetical protein
MKKHFYADDDDVKGVEAHLFINKESALFAIFVKGMCIM